MLSLNASTAYKKDLKLCKKRGYDLALLNAAINTLLIPAPLPPKTRIILFPGTMLDEWQRHKTHDDRSIHRSILLDTIPEPMSLRGKSPLK